MSSGAVAGPVGGARDGDAVCGPDDVAAAVGDWRVQVGEGVSVTSLRRDDAELCLVGLAVDYAHPDRLVRTTLDEVASALVQQGPDRVAEATRFLGGRWLLLWSCRGATHVFQDAVGMMRVFCAGSGSSLILGCDPRLLRADDTAFRAAAAAFVGDGSGEHWWPGPVGPLPGVRQLLPNHLLRLETGRMRRCWPLQELRPQPLSQAVSRCCELLENAFGGLDGLPEGLCMGLTAGLDSRVLLAASKAVADRCACFTFQYPDMSAGHEDVRVPQRLAELFGLDHVVIPTRETMSDEFAGVYRAHVTAAHDCWGPLAEAMSASPLAPRLMVKACPGGELVYEAYGPFRDEMTDVRVLRRLGHLPDEDCVWESLEWWYKDAAAAPRGPELRIAELYAWEQSTSCWQASSQEEYGLVQATFSPFDCRAVYEIGLSVERKYRSGWVGAVFQKRLIETMWPELLAVPINPVKHSAQRRMRARLRRAVPRAHLLRLWLKEGRRLRKRSP